MCSPPRALLLGVEGGDGLLLVGVRHPAPVVQRAELTLSSHC